MHTKSPTPTEEKNKKVNNYRYQYSRVVDPD
jgi:hypothetical protein